MDVGYRLLEDEFSKHDIGWRWAVWLLPHDMVARVIDSVLTGTEHKNHLYMCGLVDELGEVGLLEDGA